MANVHTVEVRFKADRAKREAAQFDRSMGRLDKRARGMGSTFARLGALAGGIGFALIARDMGQTIVATEQMKASLQTMTGSLENANLAFGALQEFAATTPYTVDQSVNAFVKMKSLGLDPTADALSSFGNTASAMGKDLNQMIEAVADASTGEFERLKEFGIKAKTEGENVSFVFQGVTTTVAKNSEEITGYLQSIGNEKFGDAMALQMERLPGKLSNLRDNVQKLWRAIGDAGVTEAFGRIVTFISEGFATITGWVETGFSQARIGILMAGWVTVFQRSFEIIANSWTDTNNKMQADSEATQEYTLTTSERIMAEMASIPGTLSKLFEIFFEMMGALGTITADTAHGLLQLLALPLAGITRLVEVAFEKMRGAFIGFADWVRKQFSDLFTSFAVNLPETGLFGLGALRASLLEAADGFGVAENAASRLKAEVAASELAYADLTESIFNIVKPLDEHAKAAWAVAQGNVEAIMSEIVANHNRQEAAMLATRALLEHIETGESYEDVLNRLAKGLEKNNKLEFDASLYTDKHRKSVEDLTRKLQPLLDKMNGVSKAARADADAFKLVEDAMIAGVIHTAAEATELLALLTAEMLDQANQSLTWETAIKRSVERLDDVLGNMWQDFVANGFQGFDTLLQGFQGFLGEMAHSVSTQPIMLELRNAANGDPVDFKKLGAGVVAGLGITAGTLIGGGGTGASMGASLGSLASLIPGIGPIAGVVGSIVGGLLGGLFDSDPKLSASASGGKRASRKLHKTTALGEFYFGKGQGGAGQIKQQAAEAMVALDNQIADFLSGSDLEAVIDALASWSVTLKDDEVTVENMVGSRLDTIVGALAMDVQAFVNEADKLEDRVTRLVLALQAQEVMADNPEFFGEAVLADLLTAVDLLAVRGKTAEAAMGDLVLAMSAAALATEVLTDYVGTDLVEAYNENVLAAGRTTRENMKLAGDDVRELIGLYDETATSVENLANGVRARYALEFELMAQLDSVAAKVTDRFTSLQQTIDDFINPKNIDDHTATLDALMAQLSTAVDPTEIDRITGEMQRVSQQAWNALPEDMKQAMGQQFIDMLAEADRLAQERLGLIKDDLVTESDILRDEVGVLMDGITDPFHLVINDLGLAADLLLAAGERLNPDTGGEFPPGGYRPGDDYGKLPQDPNSSGDISTAATTLASEGAAYRAAQATMTGQLAAAIASIPSRIVVVAPNTRNEFV